jgi:mannose-6-phosphate isomerase-like protein (cupin superfamily)
MNTGVLREGQGRRLWVVGDVYTILASGDDTGGAYTMIHAVVPPQGGPPPHLHRREDEAFYVLEGEVLFHADGREFQATAGSCITLPKGTKHFFKNVGNTPAKMLVIVSPSGLENYFIEVGQEATGPVAPPMTQADIDKLLAVAPKYGLEMEPPG